MKMYDYSSSLAEDRIQHVTNYLNQLETPPTQDQLESLANFCLYGKDKETNQSPVDTKDIAITPRYSTYAPKQPASIEEQLENVYFDHRTLKPLDCKQLKPSKDTICRKRDKNIPGMEELWSNIDYYEALVANYHSPNPSPAFRKLSHYDYYQIRHILVDLYTQQYILKDSARPKVNIYVADYNDYSPLAPLEWGVEGTPFTVFPLGLKPLCRKNSNTPPNSAQCAIFGDLSLPQTKQLPDPPTNDTKERFSLDFRNKHHIQALLVHFKDLSDYAQENPDALVGDLLHTLTHYTQKAQLSPEYQLLTRRKIEGWGADQIRAELSITYGVSYGDDWISNLWVHKIPEMIAQSATLHMSEYRIRGEESLWKTCSRCGETKPRWNQFFGFRKGTKDGYAQICKDCSKESRQNR